MDTKRRLTQQERDEIDEQVFRGGGYEIIRDGRRYRMEGKGEFLRLEE